MVEFEKCLWWKYSAGSQCAYLVGSATPANVSCMLCICNYGILVWKSQIGTYEGKRQIFLCLWSQAQEVWKSEFDFHHGPGEWCDLVAFMLSHLPVSETWENFIKVRFFFRKMVGFACKSMDWKGRRKVDMFVLLSYWLDLPAGREYLGFFFFPEGFGWSEVSSVATVREFYQLLLLIGLKLGVYILSLTKKASLRASSSPANILRK